MLLITSQIDEYIMIVEFYPSAKKALEALQRNFNVEVRSKTLWITTTKEGKQMHANHLHFPCSTNRKSIWDQCRWAFSDKTKRKQWRKFCEQSAYRKR